MGRAISRTSGVAAAPVPPPLNHFFMAPSPQPTLVQAIGRWTLTALVLNGVIGSGIYGLPDDLARLAGENAPWVYLAAAAGIGIIMAVFAEVGSQFRDAGGPYLYAHAAFGRFAGLQMAWFLWLVRLTSAAAIANLFVVYLGEFWPVVTQPLPRALLLALILGVLVFVNVLGVTGATRLSNFFTVVKIGSLAAFIVAGFWFTRDFLPAPVLPSADRNWLAGLLVLMFAFGGFEAAVIPMAEAKNPRRDIPFALFVALATVAVIYLLTHVVAMRSVPDLASSARPLADAARAFVGPVGAALVAVAALISTYGNLTSQVVTGPRLTYALAERGEFPGLLAKVHPRFRTPHWSIILWGVLVLGLAVYGSFIWNAVLSAAARVLSYGLVCAALLRLRQTRPHADAFRLPAGPVWAVAGLVFCAVMAAQMEGAHARIIAMVALMAGAHCLFLRRANRNS